MFDPQLNRAVNKDLETVEIRSDGLVMSEQLAELMDVAPGDRITVEVRDGRRPTLSLPVTGIANTLIGTPSYMEIGALNRALKEQGRVSGAYLEIDPLRRDDINRVLRDMPKVAGASFRQDAQDAFQTMLDESAGTFRYIMSVFAILIAIGVVYNSARIAFAERARDLASLRVLGFTKVETSYILLGELAVITLFAIPVGSVLGYLLSLFIAEAFSNEIYQVPVVIRAYGYGYSAAIVIAATIASGYLVQRDVNKLDMVSALKTRE